MTTPTVISFFAAGTPVAQPRTRARAYQVKDKLGRPVMDKFGQPLWRGTVYDPGDADQWKRDIAFASKPHRPSEPITGPVRLKLTFYLPRPKSHYGTGANEGRLKKSAVMYHEVKPDIENATKAVMDTLTQGCFWRDDCKVASLSVEKLYANPPALPTGCQIVVLPLENKAVTGLAQETIFAEPKTENLELFASLK